MRTFPDITPEAVDGWSLWWPILIPITVVLLSIGVEFLIRKRNPKSDFRGTGIGIAGLGVAAIFLMGAAFIPVAVGDQEDVNTVKALESVGFQEIRMNFEEGTFGAYYEGELMRGVVIEDQNHPGTFKVVETPPPS
ncbi:membrane protein [Microbacterium phage Zooman]|nr:membrane protein [Microbacterium phage Zooman]